MFTFFQVAAASHLFHVTIASMASNARCHTMAKKKTILNYSRWFMCAFLQLQLQLVCCVECWNQMHLYRHDVYTVQHLVECMQTRIRWFDEPCAVSSSKKKKLNTKTHTQHSRDRKINCILKTQKFTSNKKKNSNAHNDNA